jgi:hypothetical protein
MAASEQAQQMMDFLLNAVQLMLPEPSSLFKPANAVIGRLHRLAVIATLPRHMRTMAGIKQGRITDALVLWPTRILYRSMAAVPRLLPTMLQLISPSTVAVAAPMLLGVEPNNPRTFTPAEARERDEILPPREEYARFRELVERKRAEGEGVLVGPDVAESLELIGPTA